jgi:hypothetical protein
MIAVVIIAVVVSAALDAGHGDHHVEDESKKKNSFSLERVPRAQVLEGDRVDGPVRDGEKTTLKRQSLKGTTHRVMWAGPGASRKAPACVLRLLLSRLLGVAAMH